MSADIILTSGCLLSSSSDSEALATSPSSDMASSSFFSWPPLSPLATDSALLAVDAAALAFGRAA
eukprot:4620839-Pleurochrysis_carterae.AAC.1